MEPVEVREVRVLDGPNLYFARPAVKISLAVPGFLALDRRYAVELAERCGLRSPRPGKPNTSQRQRFVMRFASHVTRRVVGGVGPKRITVRTRPGGTVDEIVVAIPWRHRNWLPQPRLMEPGDLSPHLLRDVGLWDGAAGNGRPDPRACRRAQAIQLRPSDLDREFWELRGVDVLDVPLDDYVGALDAALDALLTERAEV